VICLIYAKYAKYDKLLSSKLSGQLSTDGNQYMALVQNRVWIFTYAKYQCANEPGKGYHSCARNQRHKSGWLRFLAHLSCKPGNCFIWYTKFWHWCKQCSIPSKKQECMWL